MIMQRWTKQARHLLPADLAQYQKHNPALLAQTFRHSSLMLKALRFVEMGDSNVQSHSIAMKILDDGIECLAEVSKVKDGLGLSHNNLESSDPVPKCGLVNEFPQRAQSGREGRVGQVTKGTKLVTKSSPSDPVSVARAVAMSTHCNGVRIVTHQ